MNNLGLIVGIVLALLGLAYAYFKHNKVEVMRRELDDLGKKAITARLKAETREEKDKAEELFNIYEKKFNDYLNEYVLPKPKGRK
jgi:hypothetical protein